MKMADAIAGENGFVGTTASGVNAISIGASTKPQGNMASGANSIAIGTDAQATAIGSVAIGNSSVASEENTVSVGRPALTGEDKYADGTQTAIYRKIVNVANGTADHDAATYGQVKGLVSATKADDGTITLHKLGDGTTTTNDIVISPSTGGGTGGSTAPDYIAAGPKDDPVPSATAYGIGSIALGYGAKVLGTSGTTDHSLAVGSNA